MTYTFSAWFKNFQDDKGVRNVTYICGTEPILQMEVVRLLWGRVARDYPNVVAMVAGTMPERQVWEQIERRPLGGGQAATLVHSAEQLQDKERLATWVSQRKHDPSSYLILVSSEGAAPRQPVGDPKDRKTELVPWLQFKTAGFVIECKPFTQTTVTTAIKWVKSICPMTDQVAGYLLNRADGNLRLVRDAARKLVVFPGTITQSVINDLLSEQPRDSYVDALLALDKRTALAALKRTPEQDFSRLIGMLDSTLELAGLVHDFQMENRPRFELIKAAGKRAWLLPDIEKVAKHYDVKRRARTRQLLLMADEYLRAGETGGVLEAVTALW